MTATTENNEKVFPLKNAETVAEQQDSETDFRLWQQLPVFIAMGLAIFILGLVCSSSTRSQHFANKFGARLGQHNRWHCNANDKQ